MTVISKNEKPIEEKLADVLNRVKTCYQKQQPFKFDDFETIDEQVFARWLIRVPATILMEEKTEHLVSHYLKKQQ